MECNGRLEEKAVKYVYGLGIDEPMCMINVDGETETMYYYHMDGLGSVVAMTESNGDIAEQYRYDIFGTPSATSDIGNRSCILGDFVFLMVAPG